MKFIIFTIVNHGRSFAKVDQRGRVEDVVLFGGIVVVDFDEIDAWEKLI